MSQDINADAIKFGIEFNCYYRDTINNASYCIVIGGGGADKIQLLICYCNNGSQKHSLTINQ